MIRIFIYLNPINMANTYTQIHIQFIFAVKYRAALIQKAWKDELHTHLKAYSKQIRRYNNQQRS
jgi:hypothetical protein